jgi:hypothetical protein
MKRIFFAAGAFSSFLAAAFATESGESLKKLAADLQKALAEQPPEKEGKASRPDASRRILTQLQMAISRGETLQLEAVLQEAAAVVESDVIRAECIQISTQLQAERQAKEQQKLAEMKAVLKAAGEAVRSAKNAQDMDLTIQSLGALQNQRDTMSGSMAISMELSKVQSALRFVTRWQDYLAATDAGNRAIALTILESLSNMDGYAVDLMPRSEILHRINVNPTESEEPPPPTEKTKLTGAPSGIKYPVTTGDTGLPSLSVEDQVAAIISRIKTPDDLAGALLELRKVDPDSQAWRGDGRPLIEALSTLNDAYREFNAGMATQIEAVTPNINNYPRLPNPVPAVRSQILTLVLPRYLGLPPEVKAKPGEGPRDFLKRISAEAAARGDYQLAAKADDTEAYLRYGDRAHASDSQASLFVTAQNQEAAGQFALAVDSYEKALALPFRIVPPKVIGERLAEIKAKHPQEFDHGMEFYRSPVTPMDPRSLMMMQQQRMMQMGRSPQPQQRPYLSVPPAMPSPTATAGSTFTPTPAKP